MSGNPSLLHSRRFLPLFLVQFLSAFADNVYRSAMLMQMTFFVTAADAPPSATDAALAGAAFIAPFFLFSATAGQLSDKYSKTQLARLIKLLEVPLLALAGYALMIEQKPLMFFSIFMLGTSAAFFGPLKYSLLPELLPERDLVAANSLTEGATFIAILLGQITGGVLLTAGHAPDGWLAGQGALTVTVLLTGIGALTCLMAFVIPSTAARVPELTVDRNPLNATLPLLRESLADKTLARTIFGISWLWFVGSVFLSLFPNYVRDDLQADPLLATIFLTAFSLGVAIGSGLCQKLLDGKLSTQYVPLGALGMGFGALALNLASASFSWATPSHGVADFLSQADGWLIILCMFSIAVSGGIFSVPLYVLLQVKSPDEQRARIVAGNNIVNAAFMVAASVYMAVVLALGGTLQNLFLLTGLLGVGVALYITALLPQTLLKALSRRLLQTLYRVELHGAEHAVGENQPAVYVVNHVSLLDGLLVGAFLPGRPVFAVNTHIAQQWWARPMLSLVDYQAVDPTNPLALKTLIASVAAGRPLVIFPEGRLTMTGALMKVYEGPGLIADKTKAPLIPIRIDGAQFTPFSYLRGKFRRRWFPRITLTVQPPVQLQIPAELRGRARRQHTADRLYHIMTDMIFATAMLDQTLWQALLAACTTHGGGSKIVEDINRKPLTYDRLVLGALALGGSLARVTRQGEAVGILLPNAAATAVSFFALQATGRVPAMLNFSTGLANMQAAVSAAQIKTIITSRRFITMGKLDSTAAALATQTQLIYLEDVQTEIGLVDKLRAKLHSYIPNWRHQQLGMTPDSPAVILFTSGSEGVPKGVVLSHRNILANRQQLAARIDFNASDIVFNALPVFHSFGLTGGFLLPVLSGVRCFLYPSPLHYRIVPELAYDTNATILFGTDTFLTGYARMAHPYDFYSLRYVFAGAERVRPETRDTWARKFGLRILEGYGATETAPALAINTPMASRPGTVGQLLPGIEYRLEPVPGITDGGKLVVRGPNIMLGYFKADQPGVLQPPEDGWYDTGDIVALDADGFVTIKGRVKRFAKIAGEMVSLNAVEQFIQPLVNPDKLVAVVAIPDERKGEQLVLFTTDAALTRETVSATARNANLGELMVPRNLQTLEKMPLLGTGKVDYVALGRLARGETVSATAA